MLREEKRLRVLRKICGTEREEVTGDWKTLYIDEHHDLYIRED
jgi:hypothetical protein